MVPLHQRHVLIEQVHQEQPERSVRQMCQTLQVNRSWYCQRPTEPRVQEEAVALRDAVEKIILDFPGYGYRRVTHALHREGWL